MWLSLLFYIAKRATFGIFGGGGHGPLAPLKSASDWFCFLVVKVCYQRRPAQL